MAAAGDPHSALFSALDGACERVFPGCVALVFADGAPIHHRAHGRLATHADLEASHAVTTLDTVYDLASLTKVLCTTTLTAIAVGTGRLELDDAVPAPWSAACPGARLVDVLEHCTGMPAHREYFLGVAPGDRDGVLRAIAETPPDGPPRTRAVYSDLGFIVLGAWLERIFDRALDDAFDHHVVRPADARGTIGFRAIGPAPPPPAAVRGIAPTEVYLPQLHSAGPPSWLPLRAARAPCAHGEVHDDNAFVMGGVAGHAGLFGTAAGVLAVARGWLDGTFEGISTALRERFFAASTVPGSTRRLGWDGQAADGSGSSGGALEPPAVGHTGFTGTSVWVEPSRRRVHVLLSNRVHPVRGNDAIRALRIRFHRLAARL